MRHGKWKHIFIWRVKITFSQPDQFQVWTSDALSAHLTLTSELQLFRQFESKEVCIKNSYPPEIRVRICLLCVFQVENIKIEFPYISLVHVSHFGPNFNDCRKKNGKYMASYFIHYDRPSVAHIGVNCSTHGLTMLKAPFHQVIQNFIPPHKALKHCSAHVVRPGFLIVGTPSNISHHLVALAGPGWATLKLVWIIHTYIKWCVTRGSITRGEKLWE